MEGASLRWPDADFDGLPLPVEVLVVADPFRVV